VEEKKEQEQKNNFSAMVSPEDDTMNVQWNYADDPKTIKQRILLLLVGSLVGVTVLVAVLVIIISPGTINHQRDGICPANHGNFLPSPQENDLDCCQWQQDNTCCRRNVCESKSPAPVIGDKICEDLLGLLNCAPCRNDSSLFMNGIREGIDVWKIADVTVCTDFCVQLFDGCIAYMMGQRTCAFGNECKFSNSSFTDVYSDDLPGAIQFCRDFGLEVSDYTCFSGANIHTLGWTFVVILAAVFFW